MTASVPVTSSDGLVTSMLKPSNTFVVPNVVHYVWFHGEGEPLTFHHYLALLSVKKFIKPIKIMFHCDYEPVHQYWKKVKATFRELEVVHRSPPTSIFGHEVARAEHRADFARLEILKEYGGIYLDTDVIAVRSFDPLRKYEFTMGVEYHGKPGRLNNGVILSTTGARFLQKWHDSYRDFSKREWDTHSCIRPYELMWEHPRLIHVEDRSINYPGGKQLDLIYELLYDWRGNYAVHLWQCLYDFHHGPEQIKKMNTTFGALARLVYYGSHQLRTN